MTLSKQTFRRGHGFALLFPSMDKKSFPFGSKCEAFGPYDSLILYYDLIFNPDVFLFYVIYGR